MTVQDWPTTIARFDELFGDRPPTTKHNSLKGVNFVTNEYLGSVLDKDGVPVEVSTGIFLEDRVFGVTFPRVWTGKNMVPDPRDQLCSSLEECYEVIMGSAS